jgi:hypothetical protein
VTAGFSSAFLPAPYLYGGKGASDLVPWKYDVAIGGRNFILDLASDQYQIGWEPRIRDSVDQGSIPGEATISPQGLWRRSQNSWHLGAGQRFADAEDSQYGRYYQSVGLDPFTNKNELVLLRSAEVIDAQTESNLFMCRAGDRVYGADGQNVRFAVAGGFGSPTTVTGLAAADVTGLASNGFNVFVAQGSSGIYLTNAGATAATSYVTGIQCGVLGFVKGRLMVGGAGSTDGGKLWNITTLLTSSVNNPSAFYTHPNKNFVWTAFGEGQNHIYAAGNTGAEGMIYRTQIKPDGTNLDVPVQSATLPLGETVHALYGYLGFLFIGTSKGVRVASPDANGDLIIGSLISTGSQVNGFAGNDRFVFFGWSAHPSGSAGVGCCDLAYFTGPNTPAYASWFYAEGETGTVVDLQVFDDDVIFSVAGVGFCGETDALVDDGYLDTGAWVWGIPDPKILAKIDGRHAGLPETNTVRIGVSADDGPFEDCGCVEGAGSPFTTFTPQQKRAFKYDLRIRLLKSTAGVSPVFNRLNARAFVNPARSQVIRVPLVLHPRLRVGETEVVTDVQFELFALRSLAREAQITNYQDSQLNLRVLVEDVLWIPDNNRDRMRDWAGTAVVTMRSID